VRRNCVEDWSGTVGTNSQSVLKTLHGGHLDLQVANNPVGLSTGRVKFEPLCPDFDVLIELQDTMTHLSEVKLAYVKGHQDWDQSYKRLNLMGQLNIDADHKASAFLDTHGSARQLVVMSPLTKEHLILLDGTVMGNYDRHLRHEAIAKPLLEYTIRRKNQWTQSAMDCIHWSAHGLALKQQTTKATHMVKLLHKMLPTTGRANELDHGKRHCPLCPLQIEDRDHILCCVHLTRQQWSYRFLQDLKVYCIQSNTDPALQSLLLQGIRRWFPTSQNHTINTDRYNHTLHGLIHQQNRIGWRQIFNGRITVEWVRIQDSYYCRSKVQEGLKRVQLTGERWLTNVILFVWDKWYTLWKQRNQRNQELHGCDAKTRAESERIDVRHQLRGIYHHKHHMEPRVQELLFDNVEQHYAVPTAITRNWLAIDTGLVRESMRRVKVKAIQGVRSIRTCFAPLR
jgi:hypothetical protein